jgi:hypothetical protein
VTDTTSWVCPNNPFSHDWNGGLSCRGCDAERTAGEAITSLLAGWEGWDERRAAALVEQHRLQALREDKQAHRAEIQQQLDQARAELAAIKQDLAQITARVGGTA